MIYVLIKKTRSLLSLKLDGAPRGRHIGRALPMWFADSMALVIPSCDSRNVIHRAGRRSGGSMPRNWNSVRRWRSRWSPSDPPELGGLRIATTRNWVKRGVE